MSQIIVTNVDEYCQCLNDRKKTTRNDTPSLWYHHGNDTTAV